MSSREISDAKGSVSSGENRYYAFKDPVVANVCDKFVERSDLGFKKYGRTLHSERTGGHKDLAGYLNDVQEELMDAILYIQAAREDIEASMAKIMRFDCTSSKEICDNCSCNGYKSK